MCGTETHCVSGQRIFMGLNLLERAQERSLGLSGHDPFFSAVKSVKGSAGSE